MRRTTHVTRTSRPTDHPKNQRTDRLSDGASDRPTIQHTDHPTAMAQFVNHQESGWVSYVGFGLAPVPERRKFVWVWSHDSNWSGSCLGVFQGLVFMVVNQGELGVNWG